jgi:hypothetical protein
MPRLRANTQPLKQSYNIGKSTNTSIPGKKNRTTLLTSLESREYEPPFRRRSSRDKYCEDNPPRGNQEKQSKIDQANQDLEDHT